MSAHWGKTGNDPTRVESTRVTDAVEKAPNCFAANFLPKDETRDDCSSVCPQTSYRSHRRVHRFIFMMRPPTQLWDRRTYGSENLRSAMQKDFFDSIDPERISHQILFTLNADHALS